MLKADRFWAKVSIQDGCWEWQAYADSLGYGRFWDDGRMVLAHRFSYELARGPIAEGMVIDHLCRNPRCVNPTHLEVVTPGENTVRGQSPSSANRGKTHCKNGHPFDEANTYRYKTVRWCRTCNRASAARLRARKRKASQ